jgi:hypothetical protein
VADSYDCLAFKQIDEDVASFSFPKLLVKTKNSHYDLNMKKLAMRNLLRVLILWSKNRTIKNMEGKKKEVSFTYGKGLL